MSTEEDYNDEVNSEDNTDPNNATDAVSWGQETHEGAEGKKIASILERKNKKIADLEAQLAGRQSGSGVEGSKPVETGLSRAEAILFAKGFTEEEVEKVKKVAQMEGLTELEAAEDELFTAWKESRERKAKSAKAQLGAANGSGQVKREQGFNAREISREDHKAMFDKRLNR
jgi:hypothetical protein